MKSKSAEMPNINGARSVIGTLHSIAGARHTYYKMPVAFRPARNALIEALTGAQLVIQNGLYQVMRDNKIETERESLKRTEEVAANINAWIFRGEATWEFPLPLVNYYSPIILDRIGVKLSVIAELLFVLHRIEIERREGRISLYRNSDYVRMEYRSGPMFWADGRISIRSKGLPYAARTALRGHQLSKIIDDPLVGDSIIRHVGAGKRNDNHFQILALREGVLA